MGWPCAHRSLLKPWRRLVRTASVWKPTWSSRKMSARRTMRWPERDLHRHQLGRLDDLQPFELVAPGIDVLRVQREERRDAVVEGVAKAGDDAAVEEDAVGQRVHECDPQPSRPRVSGARPVDCHDGR